MSELSICSVKLFNMEAYVSIRTADKSRWKAMVIFILLLLTSQVQSQFSLNYKHDWKHTIAVVGQSVTLECAFDHPVNCSWYREITAVTSQPGYRYEGGAESRTASDNCSLTIDAVKTEDFTGWYCYGSSGTRTIGIPTRIIGPRLSHELSREAILYTPAVVGQPLTLACVFDSPVNCTWYSKFTRAMPQPDYHYSVDGMTKDCSLQIANVTPSDFGKWDCFGSSNGNTSFISMEVTEPGKNYGFAMEESSRYISAVVGQSVTMACVFNMSAKCTWKRAYTSVSSQPGYSYGGFTEPAKDCSLRIAAVKKEDFTQWSCTGTLEKHQSIHAILTGTWIEEQGTHPPPVILFGNKAVSSIDFPLSDPLSHLVCTLKQIVPPTSLHWEVGGTVYSGKLVMVLSTQRPYTVQKLTWDPSVPWDVFDNASEIICHAKQLGLPDTKATVQLRRNYASATPSEASTVHWPAFNRRSLQLISEPHDATVSVGDSVTLACVFNQPVHCNWLKDDVPFRIKSQDNITYTGDSSTGEGTRDCSIRIASVTQDDFGQWRCSSYATKGVPSVHSKGIWITRLVSPSPPVILFNNKIVSEIKLPSTDPPSHMACLSENVNPPAQLHWEINGTIYLTRTERIIVGPNLYTVKLSWISGDWSIFDDVNEIICKAYHPRIQIYMEAKVEFKRNYAPRTVKVWAEGFNDRDVTLRRGESVLLACISDGQPRPMYTWESWSEADQRWMLYSRNEQNISVTTEQLGKYRCKASNDLNWYWPTTSINQIVVSEQFPKSVEDVKQERAVPSVPQLLVSSLVQFSLVFMKHLNSVGSGERKSSEASDNRETNGNGAFISITNEIVISGSNLVSAEAVGEPGRLVTSCDSGPNVSVTNLRLVKHGTSMLGFAWDPLPCDQSNGPLAYRYVLGATEQAPGVTEVVANGTTGDTKVTIEHLTASTQYQLSLSGFNPGGEGPMVTCVHRTQNKGS